MNKVELSQKLFEEGRTLKRSGDYRGALQKYRESVQAYPEDPENAGTISAMGKVFYLDGQYSMAVLAYETSFFMTIVPDMLQDYADLINDNIDDMRRFRFLSFLSNPARHIGHALQDPNDYAHQKDIHFYTEGMKGKQQPNYDDSAYDNTCKNLGIKNLEQLMKLYYSLHGDIRDEVHRRMQRLGF